MQNRRLNLFKNHLIIICGLTLTALSCHSGPKAIQPERPVENNVEAASANTASILHRVTVKDFMHTPKYTYLNVAENEDVFWIAIPRQEVEKGQVYYYQDGLKVQNFESKEFNRVFETLYLVSHIAAEPLTTGMESMNAMIGRAKNGALTYSDEIDQLKDGTTLEELFASPENYEGKIIKVKGECTKVNRRIMGRNWVHIRDGSSKEDELELTVTTQDEVAVGSIVAFEGRIDLQVDFGSGYYYDVIMQEASLITE